MKYAKKKNKTITVKQIKYKISSKRNDNFDQVIFLLTPVDSNMQIKFKKNKFPDDQLC